MLFDELPKVRFADVSVGSRIVLGATLLVKINTIPDPASATFYAAQGVEDFAGWNAIHGHLHGPGGECDHGYMHLRPDDLVSIIYTIDFPYADEWFAWEKDPAEKWPRVS